jgi:putative hydrolase of the HAD superfamily
MPTRAVFLDALDTLVELEPPWANMPRRLIADLPKERLVEAWRAEMAFYRDHSHEGRDASSLADLRARCARVLSDRLGVEVPVEALMSSVRFNAFPDAALALAELRDLGLRLVVVSNWDCSLPLVLERAGLTGAVDGTVSSATAGASKPDPAIFAPALELAGCAPEEALHVGDTPEQDVAGARAAGIRALHLDRSGGGDITSLADIRQHL